MRIRLPAHSTTHIHAEALYHWQHETNERLVSLADWQRALAQREEGDPDALIGSPDLAVEGEVEVQALALVPRNAAPQDASPSANAPLALSGVISLERQ